MTSNGPFTQIGGIPWEQLSNERLRLFTFSCYPLKAAKSAIQLASQGFVYYGTSSNDDSVICYFCKVTRHDWKIGDVVSDIHRQLSPQCPMVNKSECGNVPMRFLFPTGNDTDQVSHAVVRTDSAAAESSSSVNEGHRDVAFSQTLSAAVALDSSSEVGAPAQNSVSISTSAISNTPQEEQAPSNSQTNPASSQVNSSPAVNEQSETTTNEQLESTSNNQHHNDANQQQTNTSRSSSSSSPSYKQLGIITERPKRPELAQRMRRCETFESFPRGHHLSPKELSDAGFYFAGYGDCCRCFYCGGGLRNWEPKDNVWVEHARWFPKCAFMRQVKGQGFIDAVMTIHDRKHGEGEISMEEVLGELSSKGKSPDTMVDTLGNDPAVLAMVEMGYCKDDTLAIAHELKKTRRNAII